MQKTPVEKLPRLPDYAKVKKRPLLRSAIPSPYASKNVHKCVYISSKTPFIAAVKRVQSLLKRVEGREQQSARDRSGRKPYPKPTSATPRTEKSHEEVYVKASGKAIEKGLNLALFFQQKPDFQVRIVTSTVDAIDDIVIKEPDGSSTATDQGTGKTFTNIFDTLKDENDKDEESLPEVQVRHASVIQLAISMR